MFIPVMLSYISMSESRKMWGAVANQSTGDCRTLQLNQIPIIKKKKGIVIYCFFVWRQTSRLSSLKWINYKHGCADDLRKILKFQNKKKRNNWKCFLHSQDMPTRISTLYKTEAKISAGATPSCRYDVICTRWPIRNRALEQFCSQPPEGKSRCFGFPFVNFRNIVTYSLGFKRRKVLHGSPTKWCHFHFS